MSPAADTKPSKPPKVGWVGAGGSVLLTAAAPGSGGTGGAGAGAAGGAAGLATAPSTEVQTDAASDLRFSLLVSELPGSHFMSMSHGPAGLSAPESLLRVQLAYGEVNREVGDPGVALKLSGLRPGRFDNIVPPSASLGNKATVGAGCILGEGCAVGDKSSIKRSVLAAGCSEGPFHTHPDNPLPQSSVSFCPRTE
ncbi:hypothetical protein GPECTOR_64g107 [Gonium pectorale]|uniref:Uncharacterized protein n=1 Tax=Gonium pectorale TaxID=33097 RepID=A0A150G4A4_GONPE|nr:hypothetical protein GPECTOR_64g107 [Gonium pectorale]|eukprot:KXZ44613.1 hypothetical protein GPECTOR_64g107 [Gonium pectorale]